MRGDRSEQEESDDETIEDEGGESDEMERSEDKECSDEGERSEDPASKTPEKPPREWNDLFFQTPRYGNSGPHREEIVEYCIALMQFWARHHDPCCAFLSKLKFVLCLFSLGFSHARFAAFKLSTSHVTYSN